VLSNVNNLILPYVNKLKKIVSDQSQKIFVEIIESHRESTRKKIGIKNKKVNLRSYLLSLDYPL
jgi:hypothetical protein